MQRQVSCYVLHVLWRDALVLVCESLGKVFETGVFVAFFSERRHGNARWAGGKIGAKATALSGRSTVYVGWVVEGGAGVSVPVGRDGAFDTALRAWGDLGNIHMSALRRRRAVLGPRWAWRYCWGSTHCFCVCCSAGVWSGVGCGCCRDYKLFNVSDRFQPLNDWAV
jgi:hypothetical protein